MSPLTPEDRRARREARRRRIRRRRIGALVVLALAAAGLFTGLTINGARADRGALGTDSSSTATTTSETTTSATTTTTTTTTTTSETTTTTPNENPRGRLGSGRAVTLAFGGDVHFEGIVRSRLDAGFSLPFAPIAPVLRRADLAMVNLETTVSYGGSPTPGKDYTFRAPPTAFQALKSGGVDVATVANNHGVDYGISSLLDTLRYAKRYHFPLVGGGLDAAQAYAPYRVTIKGQRIAILAASQVIDSNLVSLWTARLQAFRDGSGRPVPASPGSPRRIRSGVSLPRSEPRARRPTPSPSISISARSGTPVPTACRSASPAV